MSKSIWLVAFVVAGVAGVAVLAVGSPPAAADETDGVSQTANADSDSEMSERQRRREERRREREEAASDGDAVATADASEAEDGEKPKIILVVEPEMECRKVVPPGSRMPKEVCTSVVQQDANERYQEEEAEAMLRRMREQSTRN